MNVLQGKWPGVVVSYDGDTRACRVEIPGITDGSDFRPLAAFENPLGDRPGDTEIRILPGDLVWLEFECGDPRFPIITGYRTPRAGNPVGWRRWQHANIQLTAEGTFRVIVGLTTFTITPGLVAIGGADLNVSGNINSGASIVAAGNVGDQGGTKTMAGMRGVFNGHSHSPGPGPSTNM